MHGYFWSCDKDGVYINQSAIAENGMLHSNFMALQCESKKVAPQKKLFAVFSLLVNLCN